MEVDEKKIRRAALAGCVKFIKAGDFGNGKGRDDAATAFMAGAIAVAKAAGVTIEPPAPEAGYISIMEALADLDD